jgi:uncharacterized protein
MLRARLLPLQLLRSFDLHAAKLFQVDPANEQVLDVAISLVDRYALRAYDAMQLSGCLVLLQAVGDAVVVQFICADEALVQAARNEGVTALNPTVE